MKQAGSFLRRPEVWAVVACTLLLLGFFLGSAAASRRSAEVTAVVQKAGDTRELPAAAELVNINTADKEELCTLPGIGPAMAERILEYRAEHGAFRQLSDLMNVRGIGSKTYEALSGLITID